MAGRRKPKKGRRRKSAARSRRKRPATPRTPAQRRADAQRSRSAKRLAETIRAIQAVEGGSYRDAQKLYASGTRPIKARLFESVADRTADRVADRFEFVLDADGIAVPNRIRDRRSGEFVSRAQFLDSRAKIRRAAMARYVAMVEGVKVSEAWKILRDFGDVNAYIRFVRWLYETFGGEEAARLAAEASG